MVLSATRAASRLQTTPALFAVLKITGAAYVGWMGPGVLRSTRAIQRDGVADTGGVGAMFIGFGAKVAA